MVTFRKTFCTEMFRTGIWTEADLCWGWFGSGTEIDLWFGSGIETDLCSGVVRSGFEIDPRWNLVYLQLLTSLVPSPFPPPVFHHFQYEILAVGTAWERG